VDVIDVLANPDLGIREQILVTPTLIRESPPPAQRIVGDLSDPDKVLVWLDMERSQAI
jgi:circadian clock protein KaiB